MTKYFHHHKANLDKIEREYKPEFDRPQGIQPQVTWCEAYIAEALEAAISEIEDLRQEVDELKRINELEIWGPGGRPG